MLRWNHVIIERRVMKTGGWEHTGSTCENAVDMLCQRSHFKIKAMRWFKWKLSTEQRLNLAQQLEGGRRGLLCQP